MKKIIISIIVCVLFVMAAIVVWDLSPVWAKSLGCDKMWFDMAAVLLLLCALAPSGYLQEGMKELRDDD